MSADFLKPACLRHRGTLIALVDRQERGPATESALEHLATCRHCESELTWLALTIHALRRMGAAAAVSPPETTWPRLRAHLERSRRRARETAWHWRLNLGGLVAGTLIVGVLTGPLAVRLRLGSDGAEPTGYSTFEQDRFAAQTEARFVAPSRARNLPSTRHAASSSTSGWRIYPDEPRLGWKEVRIQEHGAAGQEVS